MPQLIDLHNHWKYEEIDAETFPERHWEFVANLAYGVTTSRDPVGRSEILFTLAEMIETDLNAAIYLTQAALPALARSAPSDIVNVASYAGLEAFPGGTVYCAAKAGLVAFSRALAQELKPQGIRVTAICAGSVDTPFYDRFPPRLEREGMLRVEDVVRSLLYVLTSPPSLLHGEIVLRPRA